MTHRFSVRVGPFGFDIHSVWAGPVRALERLYATYPHDLADGIADFTVRLEPAGRGRRWLRPAVAIGGDFTLPGAAPLPLAQGLLAAEMAMNLQVALGQHRFLLLHGAVVERDGRALLMSGASGSGKSTLAALMSLRGWRLLGDEFALLDLDRGDLHPFPRPVSLKNDAIAVVEAEVGSARLGPRLDGTPKGSIRHLIPDAAALAAMERPAAPAVLVFPQFGRGLEPAARAVGAGEAFIRLAQASTNYPDLGEPGYAALTGLIDRAPAVHLDHGGGPAALDALEALAG